MESWYAIYTKFQHEKSSAALLSRKGFEVLLPLYRTVHRWKDRNQTLVLPLFPCYVFLRTPVERKIEILETAGVRWIVESAGRACVVPERDIDLIRRLCVTPKVQPHPSAKPGDRVRINTGPLAGIEGILSRMRNQYRVILQVELLHKSVAVEVNFSDVEFIGVCSSSSIPFKAALLGA